MSFAPKRSRRYMSIVAVAVASLLLAACGMTEAPQTTFVPQGSGADLIYQLFKPVFWVAVAVFIIVEGALLWTVFRYRRRPDDGIPLQIHGNTPVEIAWTIVPAIIVVVIATMTFRTQSQLVAAAENPVRVTVTGNQWWWKFEYPEYGVVTANELYLPENRDIELRLESSDVIHSFWIPRLSGKTDTVPGYVNLLNFKTYGAQEQQIRGECAEFCGGTHAMMGMWAVVESQENFDAWVARQQADAVVPAGINTAALPSGPGAVSATVEAQVNATDEAGAVGTAVGNEIDAETAATIQAAVPTTNPVDAENAQPASLEAQGYQLFTSKGCVGCHAIAGYPGAAGISGPNLTHVGSRRTIVAGWLENTPENMRRWLRNPNDVKPDNVMASVVKLGYLKPNEVEALTAYLLSLK